MIRVTVAGDGFGAAWPIQQPGEIITLLFPAPGEQIVLPLRGWRFPPGAPEQEWRNYTVRRHDPEAGEVDVDVVLHEPRGPACTGAAEAPLGAPVGYAGPRVDYAAHDEAEWLLLCGDETALPAIAAILESAAPARAQTLAVVEVPDPSEEQQLALPDGAELRWVHRNGHRAVTSSHRVRVGRARDRRQHSGAQSKDASFPVSIPHKYGTTKIDAAPKRVVVVGLREQDALLALGVVPVATTEWYGKHPGAIFPWAKDELGDAKAPTVLSNTDGIEVEKVAAQQPDLILGVYSGMTEKEYSSLSKIAPTVAQPKGEPDYGSSWQEETLIAGEAVGKPEEARKLVVDTEKLVADTAAKYPKLSGNTAAIVADYQGIFVYGPKDVRSRLLTELGMKYPEELINAFPKQFGGQLSDEKTDALDVGVLVWFADGDRTKAEIKRDPLYSKLDVTKQGRDVFIHGDDRVYDATSFVSVLSMPSLMEELVPRLAAAADRGPLDLDGPEELAGDRASHG